ncbi:MAG: hypothetical protein MUC83_13780 [Pirellula sp.]|nr:hypothetical protein [Pirellula sp.]
MGVIPAWIRILTVFFVVLSTLSPRFFSQSVLGDPSAAECRWEECSKEKTESDCGSEEHSWRGSSAFGSWCIVANELDRVSCEASLSDPWTVLLRELPARAPPAILS